MIRIEGVTKIYPGETRPALSDVNLTLPDRGLVFFHGPSGAGKSTLACLIAGMEYDYEGRIEFDGRSLSDMTREQLAEYRSSCVSFSFQGGFLEEETTVIAEASKPLKVAGYTRREAEKIAREWLERLDLDHLTKHRVKELSGGERKRLSLARALAKECPLLVVDEPTAGLNRELSDRVFKLLRYRAEKGLVIVITHDDSALDPDSTVELRDGAIASAPEVPISVESDTAPHERTPARSSLRFVVSDALRSFFSGLKSLSASLFAVALAITIAGFSALMVEGVGEGMKSVVGTTLDELSMVVTPKEQNPGAPDDVYLSPEEVEEAVQLSPEAVDSVGAWYPKGVNDIFTPESGFRIALDDWSYPRSFGIDLITFSTRPKINYSFSPLPAESTFLELDSDEIFLELTQDIYDSLVKRAGSEDKLSLAIEGEEMKINGYAAIQNVQGEKSFSLTIRGVSVADQVSCLHTDPLFSESFLEGTLDMEHSFNMSALDPVPYTAKKAGVIWVKRSGIGDFYRAFITSSDWELYTLEKLSDDERNSAVALAVTGRDSIGANPRDCVDMYLSMGTDATAYSLSSPVYTFTSGGMYEGFTSPLFLSEDKGALNRVADLNSLTEFDLAGYSFAPDELPDRVLSSSLASSVMGEGIGFSVPGTEIPLKGTLPRSDERVAISSALAVQLYGSVDSAVGSLLHMLMMDGTRSVSSGYANSFMEVSLRVSDVLESESLTLYHDAFFPQALAFTYSRLGSAVSTCDAFVIRFRDRDALNRGLLTLREKYPEYRFSCPIREMVESLDETVETVGRGLSVFGWLSVALSGILLAMSLHLSVKRSRRRAGDLLAMGISPRRISLHICIQSLCVGTAAALESCAGLIMAAREASRQMEGILGVSSSFSAAGPCALAASIAVLLSLVIGLLVAAGSRRLSPVSAFRKRATL